MTFNFLLAVNFLIDRIEGGGDIVNDSGGLTRWGISKKAHPDVDVENLTREGAVAIYWQEYWEGRDLDLLPAPIAFMLFDAGVNMYPPVATRFLQDLLAVKGDGIVGKRTATAAAAYHPQSELRARFSDIRLRYYTDLVQSKPYYLRYLHGWRMRVMRVADEAGRWAAVCGEYQDLPKLSLKIGAEV